MNRIVFCLFAVILCLLPANAFLPAQDKGTDKPVVKKLTLPAFSDRSKTPLIMMALEQEIEMKDFSIPMKLNETLGAINKKVALQGEELPFIMDFEAFKAENPDAPPPMRSKSGSPNSPRKYPSSQH